jgi:hypothetical protein
MVGIRAPRGPTAKGGAAAAQFCRGDSLAPNGVQAAGGVPARREAAGGAGLGNRAGAGMAVVAGAAREQGRAGERCRDREVTERGGRRSAERIPAAGRRIGWTLTWRPGLGLGLGSLLEVRAERHAGQSGRELVNHSARVGRQECRMCHGGNPCAAAAPPQGGAAAGQLARCCRRCWVGKGIGHRRMGRGRGWSPDGQVAAALRPRG